MGQNHSSANVSLPSFSLLPLDVMGVIVLHFRRDISSLLTIRLVSRSCRNAVSRVPIRIGEKEELMFNAGQLAKIFKNIEELSLVGRFAKWDAIFFSFTNLKVLRLDLERMEGAAVRLYRWPLLEQLDVRASGPISQPALSRDLTRLSYLKSLKSSRSWFISDFSQYLPSSLTELCFPVADELSEFDIAAILKLTKLQSLELTTDLGETRVSSLTRLTVLPLEHLCVGFPTQAIVEHFVAKFTRLKRFRFHGDLFSEGLLDMLHRFLSATRLAQLEDLSLENSLWSPGKSRKKWLEISLKLCDFTSLTFFEGAYVPLIARLTNLRSLKITDETAEMDLQRMSFLHSLDLLTVDYSKLNVLCCDRIRTLVVDSLANDGSVLFPFLNLEKLAVRRTLDENLLCDILRLCSGLSHLDLRDAPLQGWWCLDMDVSRQLRMLTFLSLDTTAYTSACVEALENLPNLADLRLTTKRSDCVLPRPRLPVYIRSNTLTDLGCRDVDYTDFANIAMNRRLRHLTIGFLSGLPSDLSGERWAAKFVMTVSAMRCLRALSVGAEVLLPYFGSIVQQDLAAVGIELRFLWISSNKFPVSHEELQRHQANYLREKQHLMTLGDYAPITIM